MRRLLLIAFTAALLAGCPETAPYAGGQIAEFKTIDDTVGTGPMATAGLDVTVHYTGWLYDEKAPNQHGRKFDSSRDRNEPFTFFLGGGQVIRGWDEGVAGMRVGGKRTLLLPPEVAYGQKGAGDAIPPGASLVFDVELLKVAPH
jgi:FKBP-type peptidyl-prolyl cis-trans isomerase FkpA